MSRTRILILGIAGLLLPVALATAAFLISSNVGASADSPAVSVIKSQNSQINDQSGKGKGDGKSGQDSSGKCSEPEHRSDPECAVSPSATPEPTPTTSDDHGGNSGSGSDSSGKDDQPSSSADNSGKGGGDSGKDD
jgi:hypothetical protein